jgi:chemotaxis protein histidine kinase CheA
MKAFNTRGSIFRWHLLLVPAAILLLAGCAGTPPMPAANLQAAQQAIVNAERLDAGVHAAAELSEARNRLASAQRAVNEENMLAAEWLADEARAGADLAAARTGAVKAKAVNEDMKRGTTTLVDEMQRQSGDNR